jgi:predicted RNase H-like HicB family nuclease
MNTDEIIKKYKVEIFYSKEDEGFIAKTVDVKEFKFISAFGETQEEALQELRWAIKSSVESLIERGFEIPEPRSIMK